MQLADLGIAFGLGLLWQGLAWLRGEFDQACRWFPSESGCYSY